MRGIINSFFSWVFKKRVEQIQFFMEYPDEVQNSVLADLIAKAKFTAFGMNHGFSAINNYQDFKNNVPVRSYEDMQPYLQKTLKGEDNILWPTKIRWFAKSSGTTNDRSKFIPVSNEALNDCHYKAGKDMYGLYYDMRPEASIAMGKSLVLGGSHEINKLNKESSYGDLSAVLMQNLPFWAELWRTPDLRTSLMDDWEKKLEVMAEKTKDEDITNILGVPTWTIILINKLLEITGKSNLLEIWPNLELYIHGGVSFKPYRDLFKNLIPSEKMFYMETYNASEGFFAIQDKAGSDELLLMLDYGIFYEFIPTRDSSNENAVPLSDVEVGKNYAMVISTNAGLWRYQIGDTIEFTSKNPYRIKLTGRTKHFINAFGEELIIENAETALSVACEKTHATIKDYTAAPVYFSDRNNPSGSHEWLIEFDKEPEDINYFSAVLDKILKETNSDYQAKRHKDIALKPPIVRIMGKGTFYNWMKDRGRLGGQNKVPRLSNERKYVEDILKFIKRSGLKYEGSF